MNFLILTRGVILGKSASLEEVHAPSSGIYWYVPREEEVFCLVWEVLRTYPIRVKPRARLNDLQASIVLSKVSREFSDTYKYVHACLIRGSASPRGRLPRSSVRIL